MRPCMKCWTTFEVIFEVEHFLAHIFPPLIEDFQVCWHFQGNIFEVAGSVLYCASAVSLIVPPTVWNIEALFIFLYRLNRLSHTPTHTEVYLTVEEEESCDREDTEGCKLSQNEIVFSCEAEAWISPGKRSSFFPSLLSLSVHHSLTKCQMLLSSLAVPSSVSLMGIPPLFSPSTQPLFQQTPLFFFILLCVLFLSQSLLPLWHTYSS